MAKHERDCLVCGRKYTFYDAAPRHFCSVGCEADAGGSPSLEWQAHRTMRARPAKTARRNTKPDGGDDGE